MGDDRPKARPATPEEVAEALRECGLERVEDLDVLDPLPEGTVVQDFEPWGELIASFERSARPAPTRG